MPRCRGYDEAEGLAALKDSWPGGCVPRLMQPFRKIIMATDFGESSERALERASDLAKRYSAELIVVHAVEILSPAFPVALTPEPEHVFAAAEQGLLSVVERVRADVPGATSVLLRGSAAEQILSFVEGNAVDLVVIGTHGRKGPSRWLLGSVAEKVVRACRVEVLTVHDRSA